MGLQIYYYYKLFLGRMGYTSLGTPGDHIMAITDHSDGTMPFVVTAFPALWDVPHLLMPVCHKMSDFSPAYMN